MHTLCMPTKTISLRTEAYDKLRAARRYEGESFSEVVLRARWPETTRTGGELLDWVQEHGPLLDEAGIETVEELKRADRPPADKWSE